MPASERPPIYVASRASVPERPAMWRRLRDEHGVPINSTWIDEAGASETIDYSELWDRIAREVKAACGLLIYAEPDDFPLKGAYVELGIAVGAGKPIAAVLPGVTLEMPTCRPFGSFIFHGAVHRFDTVEEAIEWLHSMAMPVPYVKLCNTSNNIARVIADKLVHFAVRFRVDYPHREEDTGKEVEIFVHPDDREQAGVAVPKL